MRDYTALIVISVEWLFDFFDCDDASMYSCYFSLFYLCVIAFDLAALGA